MTEKPFAETVGRSIQLFNGINIDGWRQAGPGGFRIDNGMLVTVGGMGLLWYSARQFGNFELTVDWKVKKKSDNSGVFVRFSVPTVANEPGGDPRVAIDQGYETRSTTRARRTAIRFTRPAPSMASSHRQRSHPSSRVSGTRF